MSARPEALLERHVLRTCGAMPGVLLLKNEVGAGYTAAIRPALASALAPWGPLAVEAATAAIMRCRIAFGLGVGSPDLVGCVDGRFVGLELKTPINGLSEDQAIWHAAARRRSMFCTVVRSVDDAVAAIARARAGALE